MDILKSNTFTITGINLTETVIDTGRKIVLNQIIAQFYEEC